MQTVVNNLAGTEQSRSVPKLRFSEFYGNWTNFLLADIADFSKGKGISKSDITNDGKLECIRYGELYTTYNEVIFEVVSKTNIDSKNLVLSKKNDVIIPASGESQIDIATASCVLKDNVALGGDLNIIRTDNNGVFLSFYLNNKRKLAIARLSQGISVVHLYSSQLKTLKINLPSLPEQQKIASFLSSVDEKIQQLNKKKSLLEDYKKGVMQKIFSQELRFKPALSEAEGTGDNYPDWEEKKLGEVCRIAKSGGTPKSTIREYYDGDIPFLAISDITKQGKYLTSTSKSVSQLGIDNSASWIVPINTIIYSMYASVGFVSINKIPLATSQAVINLILKEDVSTEYIYYHLIEIKKTIHRFIETGTQGNLNAQTVKSLIINFPSFKEQQKIANFLSAIDEKISLTNIQIDNTKAFKKGLLQQMFV